VMRVFIRRWESSGEGIGLFSCSISHNLAPCGSLPPSF
jgi:hypothetical protein